MPNWCSNSLEIKGKRKDLIALKNKLSGNNDCFTCDNIIPLPEGLWENDWCIENWGSKWEPDEPSLKGFEDRPQSIDFIKDDDWSEGIDTLQYYYTTAWSPVSKVVDKLSELFPDCYFIHEFEEEGMAFHGLEEYLGGLMIRTLDLPLSREYNFNEEEDIEEEIDRSWEIQDIANSDKGYLDFAEKIFKERGWEKHTHSYK